MKKRTPQSNIRKDGREIFMLRDKHGAAVAWDVSAIHAALVRECAKSGRVAEVRFDVMRLFNTGGCKHVTKRRAMSEAVDLRLPLIGVQTSDGVLLIDGWHRVYKAKKRGVSHLRGYVLSATEEVKYRVDPAESYRAEVSR